MIRVAGIQISSVFLDAQKTWKKLEKRIVEAKENGAELVTWGETLIPGYPQWVSQTNGANFNDENQKMAYQLYWKEYYNRKFIFNNPRYKLHFTNDH